MGVFEVDVSSFHAFFKKMEKCASGGFKKEWGKFLEGIGVEFLQIIQDTIIREKIMNTRRLLSSFERGGEGNLWVMKEGSLTLEVGTIVEYAKQVNDGHWLNPEGVESRFVPGHFSGNNFIYEPKAKTGIILKQKFIEGRHYWEDALKILEKIYPEYLKRKMEQWLTKYFS